jgi:hypothetical protein
MYSSKPGSLATVVEQPAGSAASLRGLYVPGWLLLLGGEPMNPSDLYHTDLVVEDVDAAVACFSDTAGYRWGPSSRATSTS